MCVSLAIAVDMCKRYLNSQRLADETIRLEVVRRPEPNLRGNWLPLLCERQLRLRQLIHQHHDFTWQRLRADDRRSLSAERSPRFAAGPAACQGDERDTVRPAERFRRLRQQCDKR